MKVYRQLVRTFMRSGEMEDPKQKKQKLFYILLGIISVCFIMIPCCLLVGYFTYAFTLSLQGSAQALLLMIHFIALFSVVFGINVILNVFYFAGDISFILPLPIAPYKVIGAKFTTAYWNESVMQMLVLISAFIGFFAGSREHLWMYLAAIIGVATLPMAPLIYCGILCVLFMAFTKWIKNKDSARKLTVVVTLLLMTGAISSVGLLKGLNFQEFCTDLSQGNVVFVNVMNVVFPTNLLLLNAIEYNNVLLLFAYLLANAGLLLVFLGLAQILYYRGLIGLGENGTKKSKKSTDQLLAKARQTKPWKAYLKKEWRILMRTPAFFTNCMIINIIWPVLFYVIRIMQKDSHVLHRFYLEYRLGNEGVRWSVTLIVLVITVLLTAANSIASSAITREGKQYTYMKHIPVSYKQQLQIKALLSILISGFFAVVYIVIASVFMEIDNLTSYYYIGISLLEVILITFFGLYLDTVNPKLVWDDELNALRGNTNVFFNMAYAMVMALVFTVILGGLYLFTPIPLIALEIQLVVLLIVADYLMYRFCISHGVKNLEQL